MQPIDAINFFNETYTQVRHLHHVTTSYSKHIALGKFYEQWDSLTDDFIETYQGKYGRVTGEIRVSAISDMDPVMFIGVVESKLKVGVLSLLDAKDIDLNNIVADMISLCNHTQYLLTLN